MSIAAALLASMAVLVWWPPGHWQLRHRLGRSVWREYRPSLWAGVALAATLGGPTLLALPGPRIVVLVTGAATAAFVVRQVRTSRLRALIRRRRSEMAELLATMAAQLRAGILPADALAGVVVDFACVAPAARAAALGGDVPAALRTVSREPGRELLGELAGAWQVAERVGAPLARALQRLEEASRAEREIAREVEAGVAPARSTGRLMAVLPVVGLLLGSGMGGDPVAVLTTTWIGVVCLAAGTALGAIGVAWVEHIAGSVERAA